MDFGSISSDSSVVIGLAEINVSYIDDIPAKFKEKTPI
jgi:hypothetical protein